MLNLKFEPNVFEGRNDNSKCSWWAVVVWVGAAALEGLWALVVLPTSLTFFIYLFFICWLQPSFFFHNLLKLVIHSFSCGSKNPHAIPTSHGKPLPQCLCVAGGGPVGALWCCVGVAVWGHLLPCIYYLSMVSVS